MFQPDAHKLKREFDKFITRNPELSRERIAKEIIDGRPGKCGLIGFLTSFIGSVTITIPFILPLTVIISLVIDIILSTKIEAEMIYLLAYTYGYKPNDARLEPLKNYILSRTAPEGEALNIVVKLGTPTNPEVWRQKSVQTILGTVIEFILDTIKLGRKTAGKTAAKMLTKVLAQGTRRLITKIFPIVGAIAGYVLNISSANKTKTLALDWLDRLDEELEHNTDNII
ncbi:MAG: hypothetical protein F6K39_28825 [Okeania sp. SIO3B3]|nr:hypothetical protein [Okeania sp. SIO3B3]